MSERLSAPADPLQVAGKPVGPIDTIRDLDAAGQLRVVVAASGAVADGARKGKHRMPS